MASVKANSKVSSVEPSDALATNEHTKNGHAQPNGIPAQSTSYAPDNGRYVTYEEYMASYYENNADANYEWNDGYLEAKPVASLIQSKLHLWFLILLNHYLQENPIAEMLILEIGFDLRVPDPKRPGRLKDTLRKPDIGIVRNDNPVVFRENDRKYKGTCDLCVESVSTSAKSEIERDITDKKAEYAFVGVKEYYILDPEGTRMFFYELTAPSVYAEMQPDADGVIHSNVLPGFRFRVKDLYTRPDYQKIAFDPAYSGYLMLDYQEAVTRANEAEAELKTTEAELKTTEAELEDERAHRKAAEEELKRLRSQSAK